LFVPFPYAAEDHQTVNAMSLVNKQAALIVKDSEAKEKLIPMIQQTKPLWGAQGSRSNRTT